MKRHHLIDIASEIPLLVKLTSQSELTEMLFTSEAKEIFFKPHYE